MLLLPPLLYQTQCPLDVTGLCTLIAAAEQDDEPFALLGEIHAVAGAEIDPQLTHAGADRAYVARISTGQPVDAHQDAGPGLPVAKPGDPAFEGRGLDDPPHGLL